MSYSHSTRLSIRWPPAAAYENTVTTVLTVNNYFVDLRVDTASQTVDWGIAGLRTVDEKDPRKKTTSLLSPSPLDFSST
jgi:hypothetical protein